MFLARRNSTNTLFSGENEKRNPAGVRVLRQSEDSIQYSELELEFGNLKCKFFLHQLVYMKLSIYFCEVQCCIKGYLNTLIDQGHAKTK